MTLYYDTISKFFSLQDHNGHVEFLGPTKHSMLVLQEAGLTEGQAREAVLRAIFNRGAATDLEHVKKTAHTQEAVSNNKLPPEISGYYHDRYHRILDSQLDTKNGTATVTYEKIEGDKRYKDTWKINPKLGWVVYFTDKLS